MLKLEIFIVLFFALVLTLVINISCKEKSDDEHNNDTLTTFNDPVPYNLLGHGKLVFDRINVGVCVIDIDEQRCWSIDLGFATGPSVSPAGNLIAYSKWGTDQTAWDVYKMNIDGTNQRDITSLVGNEKTPSWTSDGKQVLFSLNRFYTNSNYIAGLYSQSPVPDPNDRIQILNYDSIDPPASLLDGALVSSSSTGELLTLYLGLRTFNADGSNMKLILPWDENSDHIIYSPAWSPDESKIALLSYKMNSDIAVVLFNPDGTDPDTLVSLSAATAGVYQGVSNQISLCWSPDGSKIAFTRPDGQVVGSHIYVIGKDHTGLTQITFAEGVTDCSLSWSH